MTQDEGGEGAKDLETLHSDRMKVLQLDVCSEEQVNQAVDYVRENLEDSERGGQHRPVITTPGERREEETQN